jgi:electron transfer flavoprotein alpha subunit
MSRLLIVSFAPTDAAAMAGFGAALGMPYDVLDLTGGAATANGAAKTMVAGLGDLPPADGLAPAIDSMASEYTHIAGLSSMASKDVLARLAGHLDAAMVTDVIALDSPAVFKRPIVAGTLIETVEVLATPVVMTVRPAGFPGGSHAESATETVSLAISSKATRTNVAAGGGARPDLTQASVVVSGGRPLKDAQTFEAVIGGLADALGGAAGATRAAVDSGIAPNELQVGQTGKIVAPNLYIAAGVSGSTQHMAGIKDSKIIVAINKDPDAPIFEMADIGLVADLFDAIPALRAKLGK